MSRTVKLANGVEMPSFGFGCAFGNWSDESQAKGFTPDFCLQNAQKPDWSKRQSYAKLSERARDSLSNRMLCEFAFCYSPSSLLGFASKEVGLVFRNRRVPFVCLRCCY